MPETKILVAICTAGRPKMLGACLASVATQEMPANASAEVVVVDNNRAPTVAPIVEGAAAGSAIPMRTVHEPEPGIPQARNRAIDEALASGADWLVFIDDDEEAEPGWLARLIEAGVGFKADAVQGKLTKLYPERLPPFVLATNHSPRRDGQELAVAYTHNVAIARRVFDPGALGLRFDESLRYTGGSDSRFFRAAHKLGARIVAADRSVVTERQAPDRLTLRWQLAREFRMGAGAARTEVALDLPRAERKRTPFQLAYRILRSILFIVLSPLTLILGWKRFERTVGRALLTIASSLGGFAGLYGKLPDPYRKLDGY